jgi:hypothetical protein
MSSDPIAAFVEGIPASRDHRVEIRAAAGPR